MPLDLDHLRRYATARTLFKPTSLGRAIAKLGFVQADPIRSPARAQDLTLRHRVIDYRAGDLERRYSRLPIEEDFFVNYGFLPRTHQALMHPRVARNSWTAARTRKARAVLQFIEERGEVHPREVDARFAHGKITNWFGGSSNASTHLLDDMHYRGMLRVARRTAGTRIYAAARMGNIPADLPTASQRLDALIDLLAGKYAPLPAPSLGQLVRMLSGGVPQWAADRSDALARAKKRLSRGRAGGTDWYWPPGERPTSPRWSHDEEVRLLTPFDPIVWDRRRFSLLWGWTYRFEAYTPAAKRTLGYYALPLLWHGHIVGWGNVLVRGGRLQHAFGFVDGRPPTDAAFQRALDAEIARMHTFLGLA